MSGIGVKRVCEKSARLNNKYKWRVNRLTGLAHPITPGLRVIVLCLVVINGMPSHRTG